MAAKVNFLNSNPVVGSEQTDRAMHPVAFLGRGIATLQDRNFSSPAYERWGPRISAMRRSSSFRRLPFGSGERSFVQLLPLPSAQEMRVTLIRTWSLLPNLQNWTRYRP